MAKERTFTTEEEYFSYIKQMQEKEKNTKRYATIYSELKENLMKREEEHLEEKLFQIVGERTFAYTNATDITNRYTVLTTFMNSLSEEQINANIFLRRVNDYIKYSLKDCREILASLFQKMEFPYSKKPEDSSCTLEFPLKQKRREIIPSKVRETVALLNCQSQISSVPILDWEHIKIYKDYNEYVEILNQLATNIYFFQINCMANLYPEGISATSFKICDADSSHHSRYFSVTFKILGQEKKKMTEAKTFTNHFMAKLNRDEFPIEKQLTLGDGTEITEEFIRKTIENYEKLLKLGIIDKVTKEEKSVQKVKR